MLNFLPGRVFYYSAVQQIFTFEASWHWSWSGKYPEQDNVLERSHPLILDVIIVFIDSNNWFCWHRSFCLYGRRQGKWSRLILNQCVYRTFVIQKEVCIYQWCGSVSVFIWVCGSRGIKWRAVQHWNCWKATWGTNLKRTSSKFSWWKLISKV